METELSHGAGKQQPSDRQLLPWKGPGEEQADVGSYKP